MLASLDVLINYSQLILYQPSIERPGHVWGDAELDQGFAWSPGIVSFGVPEHALVCRVEISIASSFEISADAISCLRVPFSIDESTTYVGSVFHYNSVKIDFGKYALFYEVLPGSGTATIENAGQTETVELSFVLKLCFVPDRSDTFEIVRSGGAVHSDKVLSRLSDLE
jgi:Competence protein J (ComJ)